MSYFLDEYTADDLFSKAEVKIVIVSQSTKMTTVCFSQDHCKELIDVDVNTMNHG